MMLNDGTSIPVVGLGVFQTPAEDTERAVIAALHAGYRHIDTAAAYRNETEVGRGLVASGVPREDVYVVTKLWNSEQGYEKTLAAFDASMERLGLDYLDLYLIHWPMFLTVRQVWPDIGRWPQTVVAVGVTIVLAIGSYHFIEQPIRLRRWPTNGRGVLAGAVCMSLVAAIAFLPFPVNHQELTQDLESAKSSYEAFARQQSTRPSSTTTTVVPTPPLANVAVFGDSTALAIGMGFGGWSTDTGSFGALLGDAKLGCPVARFDAIKPDTVLKKQADCAAWPQRWAQQPSRNSADVPSRNRRKA